MKKATQTDYIRTALRVPPTLHARIHEAAKNAERTFNAEIVHRLEASFQAESLTSQSSGRVVELSGEGVASATMREFAKMMLRSQQLQMQIQMAKALRAVAGSGDPADAVLRLADELDPGEQQPASR